METLRAQVRRIVDQSPHEEALVHGVLAALSHTRSLLPAQQDPDDADPPSRLARAFSAPEGQQQIVAVCVGGALVKATITPRGTINPDRDARLWRWLCGYVLLRIAGTPAPGGNVRLFPHREELADEFAAIAIEDPPGVKRIVALNTRQTHPSAIAALRNLRLGVFLPAVATLVTERMARTLRKYHAATAVIAGTVATVTILGALRLMPDGEVHHQPPAAIQIITQAPATTTVTATATTRSTPKATTPQVPQQPPVVVTQAMTAPPQPTRSSHPAPSPPASTPKATQARTPEPTAHVTAPAPPEPTPAPPPAPRSAPPTSPDAEPPPEADPLPDAKDCGGLVHVDMDDLLDACLLD